MFTVKCIKLISKGSVTSSLISKNLRRNVCRSTMKTFMVALVQMNVGINKRANVEHAEELIESAVEKGAKVIALPECFNSPYGTQFFKEFSEPVPNGETCKKLKEIAQSLDIYLIGGSIPERDGDKIYNTCTVWSPEGELLAKYRKMHLFDIDIPGGITFKESDILSPGNDFAVFNIGEIKVGLGICYDMRFEELAKIYRKMGVDILIYPGAFNMTTGPLHWSNLQIGRALDNQVFVFSISPARGDKGYIAYGHSQVTSPWGRILVEADAKEEIVYADINIEECRKVRQQIPIFSQRRVDLYDTNAKL